MTKRSRSAKVQSLTEQKSLFPVDPHRNIFYYYKSQWRRTRDEFLYDPQLENNTTKALINVLEFCHPNTALRSFLELLTTKVNEGNGLYLDLWQQDKVYHFALQTNPSAVAEAWQKVLVTITLTHATRENDEPSQQQTGGRPDAWIFSGTDLAIMIESKLSPNVDKKQLQGHLKAVGWCEFSRVDIRWQDIYQCMRGTAAACREGKDRFITHQFLNYLEVMGMSPFQGFRNADFDLFISYDENADYRPVVKKKLTDFAQVVYDSLPAHIRDAYPDFHPGRMSRGGTWVAFRKKQGKHDPLRHCNFTAEISSDGLMFCAVIRDGRATDRSRPIGMLYRKLQNHENLVTFRKILSRLGEEYSLVIHRRTNKAGEDRPMSGADEWQRKALFSLDCLTDQGLAGILSLIREIPFPGIHISFEIPRGDEILSQPESLVKRSVTAIQELYPVLKFLKD